ncbi:S8 family serine peptidase [Egicoccus sp. AB-alg6-2]|uniref:S8 family serine peptidase n=1 Tax=Egicoccus sp. AB-alg6-2 TaxID=3242692 RepID=UPI00359D608E
MTLALVVQGSAVAQPGHAQPGQAAEPVTARTASAVQDLVVDDGGALRLLVGWVPDATADVRAAALARAGVEVSRALTDHVDLVAVLPDLVHDVSSLLAAEAGVEVVEVDRWLYAAAPAEPPSDPLFGEQWGLHNTGMPVDGTATTAGVDVRALEAWSVTRGRPDVVVALIDFGIDPDHPDLADALWVNPGEVTDGRDNDGNGYVDDVHGWNFVDRNPQIFVSAEEDWHGTAVAGVIAARANEVGIVGLAPEVRLMALKTFSGLGEMGRASLSDTLQAFAYAADNGADVINASWFRTSDSPLLYEAVRDAGVPVVAAAGNDRRNLDNGDWQVFPAGYTLPNLVSVTAIGPDGQRPAFANHGRLHIDVAAPGAQIRTTVPDGWRVLDGTSFAAPLVTAALALAISVQPNTPVHDLVDAVSWTSRVVPGAADTTTARGMLDAGAFLHGIQRPICGPAAGRAQLFADVDPANRHADALRCLRALGIAEGGNDGRYRPAATINRAQLASLLARSLDTAGVALASRPADAFADDDGSAHEHAINQLAALGIVRGDADGRFGPNRAVTRAQLASLVVRAHDTATGTRSRPSRNWFTDDDRSTHAPAIDTARDLGVVRGVATLRFAPGSDSRRDQVASLVARFLDSVARHGEGAGGAVSASDAGEDTGAA